MIIVKMKFIMHVCVVLIVILIIAQGVFVFIVVKLGNNISKVEVDVHHYLGYPSPGRRPRSLMAEEVGTNVKIVVSDKVITSITIIQLGVHILFRCVVIIHKNKVN